jgi:hypothetical protein
MGTACKRGRMMDVQVMVKTVYFINFYSQGNKRIWLHVPGIKICWGEGVRKYTCICTNSGINHARYTVHVLWCHAQSTICANPFSKIKKSILSVQNMIKVLLHDFWSHRLADTVCLSP